jgi:hypothetical protein
MPIDPFYRATDYFSDKIKIKAGEIDSQFNNIVDFINGSIIPTIYNLTYNQFVGVINPVLQNAFLLNIGDGTTDWGFITIDCFEYNGISLIKIENPPDNSILTSDSDGDYYYLIPTADNQVLRSVLGDTPIFGQIVGNCFEDRVVLGTHIIAGSLGVNNIDQNIFAIQDKSIPAIKFTNNCVTNYNLQDADPILNPLGGIEFVTLSAGVQAVFATQITSNMIPDNYFNNYFDIIFGGANIYDPILTLAEYTRIMNIGGVIFSAAKLPVVTSNLIGQEITLNKIALNSINGNRLHYFNTTTNLWTPNDNDLIGNGQIQPIHLTPQLRALLDL